MSEGYREDTRDEIGSREGSCHDGDVGFDREDFVWEDVLEEMGRIENFNIAMRFTQDEWFSLSLPLRDYIRAKRLLDSIPIETNPSSNADDRAKVRPTGVDMDAKSIVDV